MKIKDEIARMTDHETIYAPFMQLDGVGGHAENARTLSYILCRMMGTQDGYVRLTGGEYREINLSPFAYYRSLEALRHTPYVSRRGIDDHTVNIERLMTDVQAVMSRKPQAA